MPSFQSFEVFARVARLESFSAAARELRLSTTAVSRHVKQLEDELEARLLNRTTRRVSLTPVGAEVLERAERLLDDLSELEEVASGGDVPRGRIRVTAGVSLGHELLHGQLAEFLVRYPEVSVELLLTDRHVDLVSERIDLALRIGSLADSDLVARRIGAVGHAVCAAPDWLEAQGVLDPHALDGVPRIVDTNQPAAWRLSGPGGATVEVPAEGRLAVNSAHAAREACRAGLGLALLPDFVAVEGLGDGSLVDALPGWTGPELGLYTVVLERRWVSSAVRALVAHLEERVLGSPHAPLPPLP